MYAENAVNVVWLFHQAKTYETDIEILSANSELKWKNGNHYFWQLDISH